jgi:histidinol-phosphatase (PHP family)
LRFYYEPAIEAMLDAGVAMEVSTAGLRKPVGEIYPARAMIEMAADAGVPIALSSDAHTPEHLAFGYDEAVELLRDCGVKEIAVFERRQRRLEPLG